MHIQIDLNSLPDSWDKYRALTDNEQRNMAHLLSIAVKLFDHPRSEFVQGVLQECEWILVSGSTHVKDVLRFHLIMMNDINGNHFPIKFMTI